MDIMEIHKNISYETMNTDRKWTINLYSPDENAPATTGEPALWRYVIYDDEELIVETDFYSKRREDTLAFACHLVEKYEEDERYFATTEAMDNLSENLNPTGV